MKEKKRKKGSEVTGEEAWEAIENGETIDGGVPRQPQWSQFMATGRPLSNKKSAAVAIKKKSVATKKVVNRSEQQSIDATNAYHRMYYHANREHILAQRKGLIPPAKRGRKKKEKLPAPVVVPDLVPAAPTKLKSNQCKSCAHQMTDKHRFCAKCGTKRDESRGHQRMRISRGQTSCPTCDACISPDDRFCWRCGLKQT